MTEFFGESDRGLARGARGLEVTVQCERRGVERSAARSDIMVAEPHGHAGMLANLIQLRPRSGVLEACQKFPAPERCGPKRVMCLQQERTIVSLCRDLHEPLADLVGVIQISGTPSTHPQSPDRGEQLARCPDGFAQTLCTPV